jgi:hypothetical protein
MTLGTAACIAGDDGAKMERLPDTAGMKREVVIQAKQRYKYDRAPTVCGAVLREAGDAAVLDPADAREAVLAAAKRLSQGTPARPQAKRQPAKKRTGTQGATRGRAKAKAAA